MSHDSSKIRQARSAYASVMLASTVILMPDAASAARDAGDLTFKQFRQANHGTLRNRELKNAFNQQFGGIRDGGNADSTNGANSQISNIQPFFGNSDSHANIRNSSHHADRRGRELRDASLSTQTIQQSDLNSQIRMNSGVDIDLGSAERNITLGSKLFRNSPTVAIEIDGKPKQFQAGSEVTAAEYVAIKQVLVGSGQTVNLDEHGRAVGGEVDLAGITTRHERVSVDDLKIPVGLTALGDVSKRSTFEINGDLTNGGTIYAYSSQRNPRSSGSLHADNIVNTESGIITSDRPAGNGFGAIQNNVDLTLHADKTLSNFGSISSSGNLSVIAGESINNSSLLQAQSDVNLNAPSMVNSSTIKAERGNVRFDTPNGSLCFNNAGGKVEALNGTISFRDEGYKDSFNTVVNGGDFLSKEFSVFTGQGTADFMVNQLTGVIHESGLASHITAATEQLSLGNICLTGDPTYKNSSGSISLTGDITVGEALTIIASGSIFNNADDLVITAGNGTTGFPITLIAGADIVSAGANTTTLGPAPPIPAGVATTISLAGSVFGGSIKLVSLSGSTTTINTRSTSKSGNSNGGDVLLAAFESGGLGGVIDMSGCVINSGGKGTGNNGNVTYIAEGYDSGAVNCIYTGTINTAGGTGSGGDIVIYTRSITSTTGADVAYAANGNVLGTERLKPASVVQNNASIEITGNITGRDSIDISCGGGAQDFIKLDDGVTVKTTTSSGLVKLRNLFGSDVTVGSATLISTNTLDIATLTGDVGLGNPVTTDAKYVKVVTDMTSSDVSIRDINPGVVILDSLSNKLNFVAKGSLMSAATANSIIAPTQLLLQSETGSIGLSADNPIQTDSSGATYRAAKNVFVHDNSAGSELLQANTAGGTFSVTSAGGFYIGQATASISAKNVAIESDGLLLIGNRPITGLESISIVKNGTGLSDSEVNTTAMFTPLLKLQVASGNIGTSALNRFALGNNIGKLAITNTGGSAFLSVPSKIKGFSFGDVQVSGLFDAQGFGSINLKGNIDANSISVVSAVGALTIAPKVHMSAVQSMTFRVLDTSATALANSKIIVGKGASLETVAPASLGSIIFAVGTVPGSPVEGVAPGKGVVFAETDPAGNMGNIYWGEKGIKVKKGNTLFSKGANIVFNNSLSAANIQLGGGGLSIIADPPIAEGTVVQWTDTTNRGTAASASSVEADSTVSEPGSTGVLSSDSTTSPSTISPSTTIFNVANIDLTQAQQCQMTPGIEVDEDNSFVKSANGTTTCHDATLYSSKIYFDKSDNSVTHRIIPDNGEIQLVNGNSVFMPNRDVTLVSSFGLVRIKSGALVVVSKRAHGLAIYNLHDDKKRSVVIETGLHSHEVVPGRHILISDGAHSNFGEANAIPGISHRGVKAKSCSNGDVAYTSEFSIPSALNAVRPLRAVIRSQNGDAKKFSNKVLKTSAVLMYVNTSTERFQHYMMPSVTASLR